MKLERIARMPDWPARMDATMASDYLSIGLTTFLEGVDAGRYPAAISEGTRKLWARVQLDRFVESQFGVAQPSEDASWDDVR